MGGDPYVSLFCSGSLLIDPTALSPQYIPEELLHREEQCKQIASTLSPAVYGNAPYPLLLFGPAGTGKTVTIRRLLLTLENLCKERKVNSVLIGYIVASGRSISNLAALAASMRLRGVPRAGVSFEECWRIFNDLTGNKVVIAVLDEIDKMLVHEPESILLYYLLSRPNTSVVAISNQGEITGLIKDERIISRFNPKRVFFPEYTAPQLKDILKARAEKAFRPGAITDEMLGYCAAVAMASKGGDARYALDLLMVASEIAAKRGSCIDKTSIDEANEFLRSETIYRPLEELNRVEAAFLLAVAERGGSPSEILALANDYLLKTGREPVSNRTRARVLGGLAARGLVEYVHRGLGRGRGFVYDVVLNPRLSKSRVIAMLRQTWGFPEEE